MEKKKICANCGAEMDRHSKLCRKCYVKSVEKNPEEWRIRHNANCKKWREENHERANELARLSRRKWIVNNREKEREVSTQHRRRLRREIIDFFGGVCAKCGFADIRALQIDHINGGGVKDKGVKAHEAWKFRKYIREYPNEARDKFQVLCANCNWIKRETNNEHPHLHKRLK